MIKSQIKKLITQGVKEVFPNVERTMGFSVEVPNNEKFGDYSSNAAMVLAKELKMSPMEVAEKFKTQISKIKTITQNLKLFNQIEVAKPGFINFYLSPEYLQKELKNILEMGEKFGKSELGKDLKVNMEFISANPTGPLTVGNSRGGVIGDVLANIFTQTGAKTTREYYFNDAGGQIDELGKSIVGEPDAPYQGEYIQELRAKTKSKNFHQAGIEAAKIMIEEIKKTADKMGIKFDVWFKEGENLRDKGKVQEIIDWMLEKDLAYNKDGAVWFRATKFGDEKDRVVVRSNGEPTYFGVDCAYHKNKFVERGFNKCINIWGADHHGDIMRLKGFVEALGFKDKFEIIIHQFVRVLKDGKEVRMSKRAGNFVLVDEVLREIGQDAYRFFMLSYPANTHMNFDLSLAIERSQKNPIYYVQYAYARICNILVKSQALNPKSQTNPKSQNKKNFKQFKDLENLNLENCLELRVSNLEFLKHLNIAYELDLVKTLIKLPDVIEEIVGDYQVHRLTLYAREIADKFHLFYENCKVIDSETPDVSQARLALCFATQIVLKNTLDLMGISTPERM